MLTKQGDLFSLPTTASRNVAPLQIDLAHPYFDSQLITYIGNKRRLLRFLNQNFQNIREKVGKDRMTVLDGFAGSGAVARLLKCYADELHVNDIENYSHTINQCYLSNKSTVSQKELSDIIDELNTNRDFTNEVGFIEANYAPRDDKNIQDGERVFYTNRNAKIIDHTRGLIDRIVPTQYRIYCLAALIVEASIHTNTSGVFKGFHKKDGIGHFGGAGENALTRILGEIKLETPVLSDFECEVKIHKMDVNELVLKSELPHFDLVYYDPPYNQHPYGSNYFMLNIINDGKPADIQDGVSGIAKNWYKSAYNKRREAEIAMEALIKNTRADFIAISYNDEGIIPIETFKQILSGYGKWTLNTQDYNTYRGSRNLRDRDIKVQEQLWVLDKT